MCWEAQGVFDISMFHGSPNILSFHSFIEKIVWVNSFCPFFPVVSPVLLIFYDFY
jgi:hypothetical protein